MKISKMIAILEDLKKQYGDHDVCIDWEAHVSPLEVIHCDPENFEDFDAIVLRMWSYF